MDGCYLIYCDIDGLNEAWQALVEAANRMSMTFQEAWDRIRDALIDDRWLYDEPLDPRQYGISLMTRGKPRTSWGLYSYVRPIQKNLPYQRRCYCV